MVNSDTTGMSLISLSNKGNFGPDDIFSEQNQLIINQKDHLLKTKKAEIKIEGLMKNGITKDQERISLLQVETKASMVELISEVECFLSTVNNVSYLITHT